METLLLKPEAPGEALDDRTLVERCRKGDPDSFDALVRRFQREAFAVAYPIVSDFEEASDVVQEAFLSVYRSIGQLREPAAFRGWFYQIVTNLCYNHLRRRLHASVVPFDAEREEDGYELPGGRRRVETPQEEATASELKARLERGIERLPPQQKTALVLRAIRGLPFREIAKVMRCSEKTVRAHVFFAREKLREEVRRYGRGV